MVDNLRSWRALFDAEYVNAAHRLSDRWDPDQVACLVVDADLAVTPLTFGEIELRSRQMVADLAEHNVTHGHRVAVLMANVRS